MKANPPVLVGFLLAGSLFTACSSSDNAPFVPGAALVAVADCTAGSLQPLERTLDVVVDDLEVRTTVTGFTAMFTVGSVTYTVDGTPSVLAGDLSDGFTPGDIVQVDWTLTATNSSTGGGTFVFDFQSATVLNATGSGSITDGSCVFTVTAIDLTGDPSDPNSDIVGTINFTATAGGDPLTGTITFNGTDFATVNATFQGGSITFMLNLINFTAGF